MNNSPLETLSCRRNLYTHSVQVSCTTETWNNANNATHYVKLDKKRRESSKRIYYIISPRVIIKAIIIITAHHSYAFLTPTWNSHSVALSCVDLLHQTDIGESLPSENYSCIYMSHNIEQHIFFLIRHMIYWKSLNDILFFLYDIDFF